MQCFVHPPILINDYLELWCLGMKIIAETWSVVQLKIYVVVVLSFIGKVGYYVLVTVEQFTRKNADR